MKFGKLIGSLYGGVSSVRFVVFEAGTSKTVCLHRQPISSSYPQDGWWEQDADEIFKIAVQCIEACIKKLGQLGASVKDIIAIAVTNQRETTIVWDRRSGRPLYKAIVWGDNRNYKTVHRLRQSVKGDEIENAGLPLSPYFSGAKLRWLKDNVPIITKSMAAGTAMFGTVDTWLIYNLTGAEKGGLHITDVTNASRTMLMNIKTLKWDEKLLEFFGLPSSILPEIHSNGEVYGQVSLECLKDIPIAASIGNQQAGLIGRKCIECGKLKGSLGSSCSIMYNTGQSIERSRNGLLTTVSYQLGPDTPAVYALEGNFPCAGEAFNWLRDQMHIINKVQEVESMARSVANSLDVCFVPAFCGLYTPHWNPDARGVICGLTEETSGEHIVRATLEAICFQVRDILEGMKMEKIHFQSLLVDGGMIANKFFVQMLADILGITVIDTTFEEVSALGAALIAYKVMEPTFYIPESFVSSNTDTVYKPRLSRKERDQLYNKWKKSVNHSLNWNSDMIEEEKYDLLEQEKNFYATCVDMNEYVYDKIYRSGNKEKCTRCRQTFQITLPTCIQK